MPDPNLKAAAEKIKAICKEHDIAAMVCLQGPKTMEYLLVVDPSWSCARIEKLPGGEGIRIRSKLVDYPSKEAQKECIEATTGMFLGFHHRATEDAANMVQLLGMLGSHFPEIVNRIVGDD